MLRYLMLACLIALPIAASAQPSWPSLVRQYCPARGVPFVAAEMLIQVESAGNPYALNVQGRSYPFASQAEATARLRDALWTTDNIDIGLMQINWKTWSVTLQMDPALLLDPSVNIAIGCTLLGGYIAMEGDLVRGMLRYHSATPTHQRTYLNNLEKLLAQEAR